MKSLTFALLFFSLSALSTSVFSQNSLVIYDPQKSVPEKNYTDADERLVSSKILPKVRGHWSDESCDGSNLNIIGAVDGSFTKKGAAQRAIVYEMCQTGNGFANNGIVIMSGESIAAHFVTEGGWNIGVARVADLNKNGLDEIALETSGGMHQGYTGSSLSIIEISSPAVRSHGTFLAYTNECEAGPSGKYCDRSYKLTVRTGKSPVFSRLKYANKGSDEKPRWVASGKAQAAKPIAGVTFKYTAIK